jgi:hypothetical protein
MPGTLKRGCRLHGGLSARAGGFPDVLPETEGARESLPRQWAAPLLRHGGDRETSHDAPCVTGQCADDGALVSTLCRFGVVSARLPATAPPSPLLDCGPHARACSTLTVYRDVRRNKSGSPVLLLHRRSRPYMGPPCGRGTIQLDRGVNGAPSS